MKSENSSEFEGGYLFKKKLIFGKDVWVKRYYRIHEGLLMYSKKEVFFFLFFSSFFLFFSLLRPNKS